MNVSRLAVFRFPAIALALLLAAAAAGRADKITGYVTQGSSSIAGMGPLTTIILLPRILETIECNQATDPQEVPIPFWKAVGAESWEPNKPPRYSYANFPGLTSDPLSFTDANIKSVMAAVESDPLYTLDLSDAAGTQSIRMIMNTDNRRVAFQFPALATATQNLAQVPRPSVFDEEPIAELDSRTLAFEVAVPTGPFERDTVNGVKKYEPPMRIQGPSRSAVGTSEGWAGPTARVRCS